MSEPAGPTGVITLKRVADTTYEQFGRITLALTGITQVSISQGTFDSLFRQNIEQRETWVEEFASHIQGTPNAEQSSFHNTFSGAWGQGSWGGGGTVGTLDELFATISGAVTFGRANGNHAELNTNESQGVWQRLSRVDRNPIFYCGWAQFATTSGAGGDVRIGLGDVGNNTAFAGLCFRLQTNAVIEAVASKGGAETALSTGVTSVAGAFHRGRIIVTGKGTAVTFTLDGVTVGTVTTNIPTVDLGPRLEQTNIGSASITVDYMGIEQNRVPS